MPLPVKITGDVVVLLGVDCVVVGGGASVEAALTMALGEGDVCSDVGGGGGEDEGGGGVSEGAADDT